MEPLVKVRKSFSEQAVAGGPRAGAGEASPVRTRQESTILPAISAALGVVGFARRLPVNPARPSIA
jgi:hypothetical protein